MECKMYQANQKGFTLTELMVVTAIIAIIVTIAYPKFINILKRREVNNAVQTIKTMVHEAKIIAFTQRRHIVICPTDDLITCNRQAKKFLMSFMDNNTNQQRETSEQTIQVFGLTFSYGKLRFNIGSRRHHMRFFSDTGMPRGYQGNMTYCPDDLDMSFAKTVIINMQGRARISTKNSAGRPIQC